MKYKKIVIPFLAAMIISVAALAQAPATTAPAAATAGYKLEDPTRGFILTTPSASWSISAGQYSISMNHGTYFDAYISLSKNWTTYASPQEAYAKKKEYLKTSMPGAEILKDNEAITIGSEPAVSYTYKDPGQKKITREIVFNHKGVTYEIKFTVKEENFEAVKEDFSNILKGIQTI